MVLSSLRAQLYQRWKTRGLLHLARSIQEIVNTKTLVTVFCPKQCRMPLGDKNDTILKVSSNAKTRLSMENIGILIDYCFASPEDEE